MAILPLAVSEANAAALEEPLIFYRGGFTTSRPAGFTTAFRRLTGLTPSAYRQFHRAWH